MNFLENLDKKFKIAEIIELETNEKDLIPKIYDKLKIDLPEECKIVFENYGLLEIGTPHPDGYDLSIMLSGPHRFWEDLFFLEEYSTEFIGNVVIIGNDVNYFYLYGIGNEGLGFYFAEADYMHKDNYIKLSDTLADFFCKGIGVDKFTEFFNF